MCHSLTKKTTMGEFFRNYYAYISEPTKWVLIGVVIGSFCIIIRYIRINWKLKQFIARLDRSNRELSELTRFKHASCTVIKYDLQPIEKVFRWRLDPYRRWVHPGQMDAQERLLREQVEREEIANNIASQIEEYFRDALMHDDHPAIEIIETPKRKFRGPNDPYEIEVVVKILPKLNA